MAEIALFSGGVDPQLQSQGLAHREGRLQGSDPQGSAVGAHAFERPIIKGLIRRSAVVGQAVVVDVEGFQVAQGLHRRQPAVGQEGEVFAIGSELVGAPHLQHKVAAQVFPEVAVLIGRVVGGIPGLLVGGAEVVGGGAGHLAIGFHSAAPLGEIPTNRPLGGIGCGDGAGKAAQHRAIQRRPELQQGKGAVEPHIKAFVPGVVEALEHAKAAHWITGARRAPQRAAAGQVVELIAEGHAQLLR